MAGCSIGLCSMLEVCRDFNWAISTVLNKAEQLEYDRKYFFLFTLEYTLPKPWPG